MTLLHPKHEAFCRAYAAGLSGTDAAREADYDYDHAANQAYRLLKRDDVQARIAQLRAEQDEWAAARAAEREARRARFAAMRATEAETLLAKLDPVYEERLEAGDHNAVLKVISLQAQIAGLLAEEEDRPRTRAARRNG